MIIVSNHLGMGIFDSLVGDVTTQAKLDRLMPLFLPCYALVGIFMLSMKSNQLPRSEVKMSPLHKRDVTFELSPTFFTILLGFFWLAGLTTLLAFSVVCFVCLRFYFSFQSHVRQRRSIVMASMQQPRRQNKQALGSTI